MNPILEVSHLKKVYTSQGKAPFTAIDDVSFKLYPGEILGIVGESGSGKSTVAKAITHLTEPTEGTVWIDGADITGASSRERRGFYEKIQMVFQHPAGSFNPRKTLGSSIAMSLRSRSYSRKERTEQVHHLLALCGLSEELADRYPYEVSGGQCQRAAIARALAKDPMILICDEATSALDVTVQAQIIRLLTALRQERQLSLLFICHNLALVQQFCDRVLVMHGGRIIESGTPDAIIMHPTSEYTRTLVEAAL